MTDGLDEPVDYLYLETKHAIRALSRSPTFTFFIILVVSLGFGANTAMFDIVYTVLYRPLPYRNSDRLVVLRSSNAQEKVAESKVSLADFLSWKEAAHSFAGLACIINRSFNLTAMGEPE